MPPTPSTQAFDAIIVGAGAAGLIVATLLTEAGKHVLLLERGDLLSFDRVPRDHLRNHRLALYGDNTAQDPANHPRVFVPPGGAPRTVLPHEGGYSHNAFTVGGGTRVYGAMAWRFLPDDFRMASKYGVPSDSSLTDWPISYGDLAPFYEQAEWQIGVAGQSGANACEGPRARPYPMPPIRDNPSRPLLHAAADRLGWNTFPPPLLINTTDYNGRPACPGCGHCVGFACPTDSKNGTHTLLPRALATHRLTLVTRAQVDRITTDASGKPTGVSYFQLSPQSSSLRPSFARAKVIVLSAGAVESARLLLASPTSREPRGLGNDSDHVGRHLQGHYYPTALATFKDPVTDSVGPGVSIATCRFNHDNPGVIGGGMLANDFLRLPVIFYKTGLPPGTPRWGSAAKRAMRDLWSRSLDVKGPVHEIPSPAARVTLDPSVTDAFGRPVARLSGTTHPETVRTALFMRDRAEEWLRAAGATQVWSHPVGLYLSAGQHQAGTCRMGTDPATSVTDPFGRVHGHENLFVCDGSLHPTNGGFNPVLTIMALAFRNTPRIAAAIG